MSIDIDKELGNILIRYNDRWRGPCYLTDGLTFTTNKAHASRFYLLKSNDTMILNGDRVSFNCGNRTIMINEHNKIVLRDRELINREISTFIITNGLDNTEPIGFDIPLLILIRKRTKGEEYGLCYGNPGLHTPAILNVATINPELIHTFTFYLERNDDTITNKITVSNKKYDESYRNAVIIVLLLIVLILTMIVNK